MNKSTEELIRAANAVVSYYREVGSVLPESVADLIAALDGVRGAPDPIPLDDPVYAPHQIRVMIERDELADRWIKLGDFVDRKGPEFQALPFHEQRRLINQHFLMESLLSVLNERITAFGGDYHWNMRKR